jgi:transcriptional regulator GlxA family with amidase domain
MSQPVPDYSLSGASSCQREQNVVFFLPSNVQLLDLAGPAQVFDAAIQLGARYTLTFCSHRAMQTSSQGLVLAQLAPLPSVTADDLVIVPGVN